MLDDNQEFLNILYNNYDYEDYYTIKKYNHKTFTPTKKASLTDKLKKVLHLNQTQNCDITSIRASLINKFVFWKHSYNLKKLGLDYFDIHVFNAVCSLNIAFNEYITPSMIYRVLNGNNSKKRMTQSMADIIIRSLDKLMNTSITLDNEQHSVLPASKVYQLLLNGQFVHGSIKLNDVPAVLVLAKDNRELDCDNIELLDTPLSSTVENFDLIAFLFKSVKSFKSLEHNLTYYIHYKNLYEFIGFRCRFTKSRAYSKKCYKIRKKVRAVLDYWKSFNTGSKSFISDYEEVKENNIVTKIAIVL